MKLIRPSRFLLLFTLCTVILSSCVVLPVYTYDIRLERPVQSKNLQFDNDTMSVSFVFETDYIYFSLYNKLDDAIKINWRDLSASVNETTKTILSSASHRAHMIAPRSKLEGYFTIYDRTGYIDSTGTLSGNLITYPTKDDAWGTYKESIMSRKGRKTTIYLPYYIKDVYCSKTFEFVVADVIAIPPPQKKGPAK